ncbi:MarR family winged helix-turn-helix transcriptional regulator [Pseudoalteromonas sp. SG41-6]|uniref:MarR family winged helix-turn-helix transcriptional regulator n=2 Tax=Pseudoalteromonas TaxID=53246 RepID=UPI002175B685|nr:MarR family transcriptional regulator [Pseudoalteromonas sp. SG41-6]
MTESHNNRDDLICHYIYMIESHIIKSMKNEKYIANLIGTFATSVATDIEKQIAELGGRSLSHEAALVTINNHPNETIDMLSKVLGLTHSGAVRLINTLEKEGLVERKKSVNDARSVVLCVTGKGSCRVESILSNRETVTSKILENFTDEQQASFLSLIEIALGNFSNEQIEARKICKLCNEGVCRKQGCPVENAIK